MKQNIKIELYAWFEALLGFIPGRIGKYFRMIAYSLLFRNFRGKRFTIGESCHIWFPWCISVGHNSHVSRNCQINGPYPGDIQIGSNVMVGPYVMVTSVIHNFADIDIPMKKQGLSSKPVVIEDDVWIGGHSTILPGVRIGKGAVIGAGSVVTKDVEAFAIQGGVPARKIRSRLDSAIGVLSSGRS
jgi:acetyltransferase-like isoleucine patch superfamily enzyme